MIVYVILIPFFVYIQETHIYAMLNYRENKESRENKKIVCRRIWCKEEGPRSKK